MNTNAGFAFGNGQRSSLTGKNEGTPGPGNYSSKIEFIKESQPKYSILGGKIEKKGPIMKN